MELPVKGMLTSLPTWNGTDGLYMMRVVWTIIHVVNVKYQSGYFSIILIIRNFIFSVSLSGRIPHSKKEKENELVSEAFPDAVTDGLIPFGWLMETIPQPVEEVKYSMVKEKC